MLKAVDGSFEVPTAEAVTQFLLLSVGGSPCDFTLAPAQTPPRTRPTFPLPYHPTHSTTLHPPILGPDVSTTPPDTFLYMQHNMHVFQHIHMSHSRISSLILLSSNITLHTDTHRCRSSAETDRRRKPALPATDSLKVLRGLAG